MSELLIFILLVIAGFAAGQAHKCILNKKNKKVGAYDKFCWLMYYLLLRGKYNKEQLERILTDD